MEDGPVNSWIDEFALSIDEIDALHLRRKRREAVPLDGELAQSTARRKLVITDAVFSMDGDLADIPRIVTLCERHDALLLADDAHGFGVLGPQGRGSLAHFGLTAANASRRIVYMATL